MDWEWLSRHWGKLLIGTTVVIAGAAIVFYPPASLFLAETFSVAASTVTRSAAAGIAGGVVGTAVWIDRTEERYQARQERREDARHLAEARAAQRDFQENTRIAADLARQLAVEKEENQRLQQVIPKLKQEVQRREQTVEKREQAVEKREQAVQRDESQNKRLRRRGNYSPRLHQSASVSAPVSVSDSKITAGRDINLGPVNHFHFKDPSPLR
ncbi:MAG: hypothetical protein K0Q74_957 [Gammaproteobacteria bacterium]|jgi:hypothetical protein|nr:hypothetical protein [Gammaproteobacteria bacterium]